MIESSWIYSEERPEETQVHIQAPFPLSHVALPQTDSKEATATCIPPSCTNTTLGPNKFLYSVSSLLTVCVCDGQLQAQ
jgi:hypothetical protein